MVVAGTGIHANPSSEISQSKCDPDGYTEQQKIRELCGHVAMLNILLENIMLQTP